MQKMNTNDRDVKPVIEEARGGTVKVSRMKERGDEEKDRAESEITVATFAELVSVTSGCAGARYATQRRL